jgi:hypothetical protein
MNVREGGSGRGPIWGSSQAFTLSKWGKLRKSRSRQSVSRPRLELGTTSIQIRIVTTWAHLLSENHYEHYATESRECVDTYLHVPLTSLSNGVNAQKNRIDYFCVCNCWRCACGLRERPGCFLYCPLGRPLTYLSPTSYSNRHDIHNTKHWLLNKPL